MRNGILLRIPFLPITERQPCFVFTPQVIDCLASSYYPLRLGIPILVKPTPLQLGVKEHCSAVDWRVIGEIVVLLKLLPRGVNVVSEVMLKRKELSSDLALGKVISRVLRELAGRPRVNGAEALPHGEQG
jgi:hypothetical protein